MLWMQMGTKWMALGSSRFQLFFILLISFCFVSHASPSVTFHEPQPGQTVSGRTFVISVEVSNFVFPDHGKGILYLDGGKLLEVRQPQVTISMDGAGGLYEGQHTLRVVMYSTEGVEVGAGEVKFLKEGAPEETAGPFHDDRFDDDALEEMQRACGELASQPKPARTPDDPSKPKTIALGLPVLSSKTKYDGEEEDDMRIVQVREEFITEVSQLPMFRVFIPSLMEQLQKEAGKFQYGVYLGFDLGDPVFDNAQKRAEVHRQLEAVAAGHPVRFHWFQYAGMEGKVFTIYNDLFRQAYNDGADYFYMVNDDLLFVSPNWADSFVEALEGSETAPGFGVAGPLDIRDRHKHHMCFAFHSRLHYEIFGEFYPAAFQNWWSDYWASLVYGPAATFWLKHIEVRNTEIEGRRYPAFWEGNDYLQDEVTNGRNRLASFCRCASSGGQWRFDGCQLPPSAPPFPGAATESGAGAPSSAAQRTQKPTAIVPPRRPPSAGTPKVDL